MKTIFKAFDVKEEYINEYIENWDREIMENFSLRYKNDLMDINTFVVNPYIQKFLIMDEIEMITEKLLCIFPVSQNKKFNDFIYSVQFSSCENIPIINEDSSDFTKKMAKPNAFNISDYSIFEMDGYIIVFHLDLYNGVGVNITSIFRKDESPLLKEFSKIIEMD